MWYPSLRFDLVRGLAFVLVFAFAGISQADDGAELYKENCAPCHSSATGRAPTLSALKAMSEEKLLFSLTNGKMKEFAKGLSLQDRQNLVGYLAAAYPDPRAWEGTMACASDVAPTTEGKPLVAGWGYGARNHRHQPADLAGLRAGDLPNLELAWAQGFPGATDMRSQPVIVGTTLYLGVQDRNSVYAFDLGSGCLYWTHTGGAPLRSALGFGRMPESNRPFIYYGDVGGMVYAVDANDGSRIWATDVKIAETTMLTGSPVLHANRLYVPLSSYEIVLAADPSHECCKAHGGVSALDVRTGKIIWTYHTTEDAKKTANSSAGTQLWGPAGAPVWTTPAIDAARNLLYVGTGQNYSHPATGTSDAIIALDLDTGKPAWIFQALADDTYNAACGSWVGQPDGPNRPDDYGRDFDFGASVVIARDKNGKDILLAGQKSGDVWALDPDDNGAVVWRTNLSDGTPLGGVHWGMTVVGNQVFVPIADPEFSITRWNYASKVGIAALDITTGEVNWRHHASRGCALNPAEFGGPSGLHNKKWPDCSFYYGNSAAATGLDDIVFAGRLDGKLQAFAPSDGKILWEYDTKRPYDTLNGVEAHGGALDNSGWLVVGGGWLVVQSGYGLFKQMPGNVVLVFKVRSPDEKS